MTDHPETAPDDRSSLRIWGGNGVVDLLNPRPEDFHLPSIARSLTRTPRYGGLSDRFISVSHHLLLCDALVPAVAIEWPGKTGETAPIDWEWVRRATLVHDMAEAYVGDLIAPIKFRSGSDWFRKLENRLLDLMHARWCPAATDREKKARFHWGSIIDRIDRHALRIEVIACMPESAWGYFEVAPNDLRDGELSLIETILGLPDPERSLLDVCGSVGMS